MNADERIKAPAAASFTGKIGGKLWTFVLSLGWRHFHSSAADKLELEIRKWPIIPHGIRFPWKPVYLMAPVIDAWLWPLHHMQIKLKSVSLRKTINAKFIRIMREILPPQQVSPESELLTVIIYSAETQQSSG